MSRVNLATGVGGEGSGPSGGVRALLCGHRGGFGPSLILFAATNRHLAYAAPTATSRSLLIGPAHVGVFSLVLVLLWVSPGAVSRGFLRIGVVWVFIFHFYLNFFYFYFPFLFLFFNPRTFCKFANIYQIRELYEICETFFFKSMKFFQIWEYFFNA